MILGEEIPIKGLAQHGLRAGVDTPVLGWGRGTAGMPRWPHGRAHHSQGWGAGHVSCKGQTEKREIFEFPGAALSFCLTLPGMGERCWLLTPECGLQHIPLLQVQVREGRR